MKKRITHGVATTIGTRQESWALPKDKDSEYRMQDASRELDVRQLMSTPLGYRLAKGFSMLLRGERDW